MLCALAIVFNMVDTMLSAPLPFNIRFGIANIVAIVALKKFGIKEMIIINFMRGVLGALLGGRIFGSTFWISMGGIFLSSIIMTIFHLLDSSILFTSILSSIAHTLGQVIVVIYMYKQPGMISILPILLVSSIGTGILTGYISKLTIERVRI